MKLHYPGGGKKAEDKNKKPGNKKPKPGGGDDITNLRPFSPRERG